MALPYAGGELAPGQLGLDLEGDQLVGEPAGGSLQGQVGGGQTVHRRAPTVSTDRGR
jgi:hypothetical protein